MPVEHGQALGIQPGLCAKGGELLHQPVVKGLPLAVEFRWGKVLPPIAGQDLLGCLHRTRSRVKERAIGIQKHCFYHV